MCRSEACSLPVATVLPADMPFPRPRAQIMKPKLPRKLANSARINLNKYWHALEELMPVSCRAFDESDSNAINENLDNERRLAAMRLSELQEVGDSDPSDSSGSSTFPSTINTALGKKTSYLKISTTSTNVLLDTQSSSSALSSSLMNIDYSPSSSTSCDVTSTSITESSCFFPSFSNTEYPDENTPPLKGFSITGGTASR